jgi:hypothetical protein
MTVDNVGTFDRVLRLLLAVTMLAPAFFPGGEPLGWLAIPVLASIYPTTTAVIGWDPIYHALNVSTARAASEPVDAVQVAETLVRRYHRERITGHVDTEIVQSNAANKPQADRRAA